jgi:stage III sporulation protein SpoIIIAA
LVYAIGSGALIWDILEKVASKDHKCSVLILGPSSLYTIVHHSLFISLNLQCVDSGKTLLMREISRILADDLNMRTNVVVVDTFKSIGGHELKANHIGRARRLIGIDRRLRSILLMYLTLLTGK